MTEVWHSAVDQVWFHETWKMTLYTDETLEIVYETKDGPRTHVVQPRDSNWRYWDDAAVAYLRERYEHRNDYKALMPELAERTWTPTFDESIWVLPVHSMETSQTPNSDS